MSQKDMSEIMSLKEQVKDFERLVSEKESKLQTLNRDIEEMTSEKNHQKNMLLDKDYNYNKAQSELESITKKLRDAQTQNEGLEELKKEMKAKVNQLNEENHQLRQDLNAIEAQKNSRE